MAVFNKSSYFVVLVLSVAVSAFKILDNKSDNADYPFYVRKSWGALPPENARPLNTPVPYVVIHHTYIPAACYSVPDCARDMRSMQRYHKSLGWGDIGYNFCVGAEGSAFEGRGWHTVGIHARAANNYSVGICLIGDWRERLPSQVTLETTKALIADGVSRGIISPDYKLIGHMQVNPTECPGRTLLEEVSTWPHYQPGPFPAEHSGLTSNNV